MKIFSRIKDFVFRCRYGFLGAPVLLDGQLFRLDESLRRWNVNDEASIHREFRTYLQPGDVAIDIGANFGLHTIYAAHLVGKQGLIYAFEPVPENLRLLKHNLYLNNLVERVHVEPVAVSNSSNPTLEMALPGEGLAVTATLHKKSPNNNSIEVRNVRLDDFQLADSRPIKLIKIDVEGAEMEVLRGAENFLQKHRPVLLIEVHAYALPDFGTSSAEFTAFLDRFGYRETRLLGNHFDTDQYYQSKFIPKPES